MKSLAKWLLALAPLAPSFARAESACGQGTGPDIAITNLAQGETVGYELLLIKGAVAANIESVNLNLGDNAIDYASEPPPEEDRVFLPRMVHDWPAGGGRFKAIVHLAKGPNRIVLSAPGYRTRCLDINYAPSASTYRTRIVFVLAKDALEDPSLFQSAPGDSSGVVSAKRRLGFGALLIETAMAELMYQANYPRRTVHFRRDSRDQVDVTLFHSKRTDTELRSKTPDQLYDLFRGELDSTLQDGHTKFLCMLGGFGSGALGGNNQAMFGTSTLYSWAQGLDELIPRFSDSRKPGEFKLEDESAFRNTFWSNYSTGIGATLHELGHALGLPNLDEPDDVMQRGFDRFNRIFMLKEEGTLITDQAVHYGTTSADLLSRSPWVVAAGPVSLKPQARAPGTDARLARVGDRISLQLPAAARLSLDLYSARGAKLARIATGSMAAGPHSFRLPHLEPGVYVCAARFAAGAQALRLAIAIP